MLVVIFRATIADLDSDYTVMATALRQRALEHYGCLEFVAVTEGGEEIALSYWRSEEDIRRWKADPLHAEAQRLGRQRWYNAYSVQVTQVLRAYGQESDRH